MSRNRDSVREMNNDDNDTVFVKIENKVFSVKKSTLVSSSEYFRIMFSGNFVESRRGVVKIDLVRREDFQLFLDFIVDGKLRFEKINAGNMARIFETASMLRMTGFIDACQGPLMKEWHKFGHAGEMFALATEYGMDGLRRSLSRLLANCVEIASENGHGSEIYFGKGDSKIRHVDSQRISYRYMLDCLRETETAGDINFGTTRKEHFTKRDRDAEESKYILEWVCGWLMDYLEDPGENTDKIEALMELCDLKFVSFEQVEQSLADVGGKRSLTDEPRLIQIRECIYKEKARIQNRLRQVRLEFVLISPNVNRKDQRTKCLRCRSVLEGGQLTYKYENFDIPFHDAFIIPMVPDEDGGEFICLYKPGFRQCVTFNLPTKQLDYIRDISPPIIVEGGLVAGGYLLCLGWHDRFWDCREPGFAFLATVNLNTSELTREMVREIKLCNHYRNSNMAYLDGHFYFVACGPERDDAYKPFLYRYNPENKKLAVSEQVYRHAKERTSRFHLAVHEGRLVVIGRDKVIIVNVEYFDGEPSKVIHCQRGAWTIWESFSRESGLYLMAQKNFKYYNYKEPCLADLFVFRLDLERGLLQAIGCVVEVFTDVNHRCSTVESAHCPHYSSLGLIAKLN